MSNIIKFDDNMKLPAHLRDLADTASMEEWGSGQVSGFPVLSIKGKVFHIVRGDDAELITRPDDPDEAATSLEVVILKTHKGVARVYYKDKYEEGSQDKPLCYSNDGIAPADDAEEKQAKKCAVCPHSQWGSRITDNGKKGKACSEVKRLAVAEPGYEDDPMLMRIPPTSLRNWDDYLRKLAKKGISPAMVVTKVGFDATVSHQLFTFKPTGFLGEASAKAVAEMQDNPVVEAIIGTTPVLSSDGPDGDDDPAPAPKERQRASRKPKDEDEAYDEEADEVEPEEKPARRRKPAPEPEPEEKPARRRRRVVEEEPEDEDEDEDEAPAPRRRKAAPEPEEKPARRRRQVVEEEPEDEDDEPEEKPRKKSAAESAKVVDADDDLEGELDAMLGDLEFDD